MGRETNKQRREKAAASAREKAATARAQQKRAEQRRRAMTILSTVVVVALVGVGIGALALTHKSSNQSDRVVAGTQALVSSVAAVSPAAPTTVGEGSASFSAKPTKGDPPLTKGGKPEVLYIGGEFCPYCAAERWSLVQALSRFGTLSRVSQIHSAADDGDIATFSFYKSSYTSKYISFVPVESEDRAQKPLQTVTSAEGKLFKKYTTGFPFIDFGGKYYQAAAGYNFSDLSGLTQAQIAAKLKDPTSTVAKDIIGEANNLTATICKTTNDKPANVCSAAAVTTIQKQLAT